MQNTEEGHWPKANITKVSFHSTLTKDVFHGFPMDNATVEAVFEAMLKQLMAEKIDAPENLDDIDVYIVGNSFRTFIGYDDEGWPYAIISGTNIEGIEYPMVLLRVFSEGFWFRTIQHTFFLNGVYPVNCSLQLYKKILAIGMAKLGMAPPEA